MALIKCPECKAHISDTAPSCPKCGYQFHSQSGLAELLMKGRWQGRSETLVDAMLDVVFAKYGKFSGF